MVTFGSLFAGIGGFDLGLERAGMTCLWQCEIDKYANQVLENHWTNVRRYNDIVQLSKPESVDLICGGFPCQDLSIAGKRSGLSGERSGLFFELIRVVNETKPKWLILENVPGLLSSHNGQDMQTVLETLVKCGYSVAYRVLDSQNFGVAQRRRRVYIVGSFGNADSIKVLFEPESLSVDLSKGKRKKCADAETTGSLTARDYKEIGSTIDDKIIIEPRTDGTRIYTDISHTLCSNPGGSHPVTVVKTSNTKANGNNIKENVSYTLDGSINQAVLQARLRRLTPIEYERLQGFPDNWTAGLSDTQRYKTLGNAVTVNVIEWIGRRIKLCVF